MTAESLPAVLEQFLQNVDGLQAVVVTDRDGVVVAKVGGSAISQSVETAIVASFSASSDQASKLSIGKNKTIITSFGNHQIVQFNLSPLLVTLVAAPTANTGILLDVGVDLQTILQPAAAAIQEIAASK